jgi:hypothetical protein
MLWLIVAMLNNAWLVVSSQSLEVKGNSNTLRKVNMDILLQSSHVDLACIHNIVVMELSQPTKLISMQMKYTLLDRC